MKRKIKYVSKNTEKLELCYELLKHTGNYKIEHIILEKDTNSHIRVYSKIDNIKSKTIFSDLEISVIPEILYLSCYIGIDSEGYMCMHIF